MPSIRDTVANLLGVPDNDQGEIDFKFHELTEDLYKIMIFIMIFLKLILVIMVLWLKKKNAQKGGVKENYLVLSILLLLYL
ncbi:TPA_asm: P6 [Medicago alphacytorhabdovirus 1]|nr:TPA_asm: P6 [Medicago alphacytorhabdovirus 1]